MRIAGVLFALVVSAGSAMFAQQPVPQQPAAQAPQASAQKLPEARTIIDAHIKAIGGRDAVMSHSSTHAKGTMEIKSAGMTGTMEIFAAKPNKQVLKLTMPGVGEVEEGFDGTNAWSVNPMTGAMLLDGKQLEEKKHDTDFYGELKDPARYQSITTVERTKFDNRDVYKIKLVKKGGGEDFEFYDVATGLKAGGMQTRETPMGTITATTYETEYKKFGNLMIPTVLRQSVMGTEQLITVTSVEFDKVPDSAFEPPASIKALIKK